MRSTVNDICARAAAEEMDRVVVRIIATLDQLLVALMEVVAVVEVATTLTVDIAVGTFGIDQATLKDLPGIVAQFVLSGV